MASRQQRKRTRASTWIIVMATATVVGFILWSLWAKLDQITRAAGRVIPTGRVQIVQSADGGVIRDLRVREGDVVKRGQLLVTLDRTALGASVGEGQARVAALKTAMVRIEAELFGRPLAFPPDVAIYSDFVANQRALYARRRQALASELQSLRSQASLVREELNLNQPLVDTGDVPRAEVIRMERQLSDLQGQIVNRQNQYQQDLQTEYAKTAEELVSAQQTLTQRGEGLGNTELRAPVDGIVDDIRITTVGGVLRAGDEVMKIVPTGRKLIVEARVSPSDIAFIRRGQQASVKFDAYDSARYGVGRGQVVFISADTTLDERAAGPQDAYYRVQLNVDTSAMRPGRPSEPIEIQPGMTATVEIKTGENTVFGYLTKPILKTTSEALRER
jgi:adhesin transport system membrane fusion protein